MTAVKICGVTEPANAQAIAALGIDYLGLNFWAGSPRVVEVAQATAIARAVARHPVRLVGVFVNASIARLAEVLAAVPLDVIQLHGDEDPATVRAARALGPAVWRVVRLPVAGADALVTPSWPDGADAVVVDAATALRGGSGQPVAWPVAAAWVAAASGPVLLAGGLNPDNVAAAIAQVRPWAIDLASGVEQAPGIKDPSRVAAVVAAARAWEAGGALAVEPAR